VPVLLLSAVVAASTAGGGPSLAAPAPGPGTHIDGSNWWIAIPVGIVFVAILIFNIMRRRRRR
jgi:hypothetical protein